MDIIAFGIARVSTKEQSVDVQINEITTYCNKKNYKNEYILQLHSSAYNKIPSEIDDFLTLFETKDYDKLLDMTNFEFNGQRIVIVFSDVDRLSRNVIHGIEFINRIKKLGFMIEFIREPIIDCYTPDGMNLLRIKFSQAELEADKISQRVILKNKLRRITGEHIGPVPFGKHIVFKKLVNNPEEIAIIDIIDKMNRVFSVNDILVSIQNYHNTYHPALIESKYSLYRGEKEYKQHIIPRLSLTDMANIMNDFNITKRGKKWTARMIDYVYKYNCKYIDSEISIDNTLNIYEYETDTVTDSDNMSTDTIIESDNMSVPLLCDLDSYDNSSNKESEHDDKLIHKESEHDDKSIHKETEHDDKSIHKTTDHTKHLGHVPIEYDPNDLNVMFYSYQFNHLEHGDKSRHKESEHSKHSEHDNKSSHKESDKLEHNDLISECSDFEVVDETTPLLSINDKNHHRRPIINEPQSKRFRK